MWNWQDISDAPKDGTTILVAWQWDDDWEMHTAYCVIDDGIWWHYASTGYRIENISHPTHWVHLQSPEE